MATTKLDFFVGGVGADNANRFAFGTLTLRIVRVQKIDVEKNQA